MSHVFLQTWGISTFFVKVVPVTTRFRDSKKWTFFSVFRNFSLFFVWLFFYEINWWDRGEILGLRSQFQNLLCLQETPLKGVFKVGHMAPKLLIILQPMFAGSVKFDHLQDVIVHLSRQARVCRKGGSEGDKNRPCLALF